MKEMQKDDLFVRIESNYTDSNTVFDVPLIHILHVNVCAKVPFQHPFLYPIFFSVFAVETLQDPRTNGTMINVLPDVRRYSSQVFLMRQCPLYLAARLTEEPNLKLVSTGERAIDAAL